MSDAKKKEKKTLGYFLKGVVGAGAAACITVSFIHPIDVIKTRL